MRKLCCVGLIIIIELLTSEATDLVRSDKVCRGTSYGLANRGEYNYLKSLYANCTIIDGNLEIVFIESTQHDFSFLRSIREVMGYVLIVSVFVDVIPLENLRVIRGRTQYQISASTSYYSLFVAINGFTRLPLVSLHEILAGDVYFSNNNRLCYVSTINWQDILSGDGARVEFYDDDKENKTLCGQCDKSCSTSTGSRHCWGPGKAMCQQLTRVICSQQCEGHCNGSQPNQCCHPECAGGCNGPKKRDCWTCKNFNNNGSCEAHCPPLMRYNQDTYRHEPNPDAKYAFGPLCVDKCPEHLMISDGACVSDCGEGRKEVDRVCRDCDGGVCDKECEGLPDNEFINAHNIERFRNCTVIKGSINILQNSILGDRPNNVPPLNVNQLNILNTVVEVTHYVRVQAKHKNLRSLSFLSNLRVIHGRELDSYGNGLQVQDTSIEQLGLVSLQSIKFGKVILAANKQLCYISSVNWTSLLADPAKQKILLKDNKNDVDCRNEGQVCHRECSVDGCWGHGDMQCLSCRNRVQANKCVSTCDLDYYDAGNNTCLPCDAECECGSSTGCTHICHGPGPDKCERCRHFKDGPFCVVQCPQSKYADEHMNCTACNSNCVGGCTGPENTIGVGACKSCAVVMITVNFTVTRCLPEDAICPRGYYSKRFIHTTRTSNVTSDADTSRTLQLAGMQVCTPCHAQCMECIDASDICEVCVGVREERRCKTSCSPDYYLNVTTRTCERCDRLCLQCYGPTHFHCISCRQYVLYHGSAEANDSTIECVDKCPLTSHTETVHRADNRTETVCVPTVQTAAMLLIVGVPVSLFVLAFPLCCLLYCVHRRKEKRDQLINNYIHNVKPSDKQPDMSHIRLIKQSEIRRGHIIGSGAFGTVYRGVWVPSGQNVRIPVAIKVLQEDAGQAAELLDEARVMASVNDTYCVPVVAICMTAQLMLLTQLMPLGSLLDYVRAQKASVDSHTLLIWATQIAKGMHYLEERGIVHRDLAARNVLVQKPHHVRITDFGLAKLLDSKHAEFKSQGGRMPIKWLALECIQHRTFTHKSDVWSYGVTLWEIFTFGERPYENVRARDIPEMLEKGERLSHPLICTIDVYMIMVKCWMLEARTRPTFDELASEFEKMCADPGRYLVIEGDRLRQLPSNAGDNSEIMRMLSGVEEGPEQLMNVEDYLNPNRLAFSTDVSYPVLSVSRNSPRSSQQTRITSQSDMEVVTPLLVDRPSSSVRQKFSSTSGSSSAASSVPSPTRTVPNVSSDNTDVEMNALPASDWQMPPQISFDEDGYLEPKSNNSNGYLVVLPEDPVSSSQVLPALASHDNPEYFSSPTDPPNGLVNNNCWPSNPQL